MTAARGAATARCCRGVAWDKRGGRRLVVVRGGMSADRSIRVTATGETALVRHCCGGARQSRNNNAVGVGEGRPQLTLFVMPRDMREGDSCARQPARAAACHKPRQSWQDIRGGNGRGLLRGQPRLVGFNSGPANKGPAGCRRSPVREGQTMRLAVRAVTAAGGASANRRLCGAKQQT